jgi:RNA polymerase sigma factor (sigma-70 family)
MAILPVYSEAELVSALKKGDGKGYAYLYRHYQGALHFHLHQFIPASPLAEDVLQEVFLTIFKNIDKYDPEKSRLFTWMLTITRNTALNTLQSKAHKQSLKNDNPDFLVDENAGLAGSTDFSIVGIGLREKVHALPKEWKEVLELAYFQGFTREEIGKILGIPEGTVKTRIRRALIELRKTFLP